MTFDGHSHKQSTLKTLFFSLFVKKALFQAKVGCTIQSENTSQRKREYKDIMPRPSMPQKHTPPTTSIRNPRPDDKTMKANNNSKSNALTNEFTEQEILEFKDAFRMFDIDGGGTIETHELKQVMGELGEAPTDEDIEEMINLVDENGDGEIDFNEFLNLMRLRMGESGEDAEKALREVFDIFDADGSGFIDRDEMRALMKKLAQDLSEEEISDIMEEVDIDGDGEISFEEFKALMV